MYRVYNYGYLCINGEWVRNRVPFRSRKAWKTIRGAQNYINYWNSIDEQCKSKDFYAMVGMPVEADFIAREDEIADYCTAAYTG